MQTATQTTKRTKKAPSPTMLADISTIKLVPLDLIDTLPQIRKTFDQESIEDLARDITLRGLLQPVLLNATADRFTLIAGERRLRAVKHNGSKGIPALLVKTSTEDALLIQLAENIQREDLSLDEQVEAIKLLYDTLGNLAKVAEVVKKSKAWCSKRYAMTQTKLHYMANNLLSEGITEDLELLKAYSSLTQYIGGTTSPNGQRKSVPVKPDATKSAQRSKLKKSEWPAKRPTRSSPSLKFRMRKRIHPLPRPSGHWTTPWRTYRTL
jgi:ParB/RepB/Spo0J family partition protein